MTTPSHAPRSSPDTPTRATNTSVLRSTLFDEHVRVWEGRSRVRSILIPILVAAVGTILLPALFLPLNWVYELPEPLTLGTVAGMVISTPILVFAIVKISKVSLADLGFVKHKWFRVWLGGAVGAALAASIVIALASLAGAVTITWNFTASHVWMLAFGLLFFTFQGMSEEIVYRLYLLPAFTSKLGAAGAIALSSILFTLVHLGNPNATYVGMFNIWLYGVVFAVLYWRIANAWLVAGYHTAWNFLLSMFYGSYVSGIQLPASIFSTQPIDGKDLWSGGTFGLEGSLLTSAVGVAVIIWCVVTKPRSQKDTPLSS